jgi:hypothetical protein
MFSGIKMLRRNLDTKSARFAQDTARSHSHGQYRFRPIPYAEIAQYAETYVCEIARCVAPAGKIQGREYVALNPTRQDRNVGSFRLNLRSGRWADFATGDRGTDIISYVAYCLALPMWKAAGFVARWAGAEHLFDVRGGLGNG